MKEGHCISSYFWTSQVEVRSLDESPATSHTFPTVDLVTAMEHSPVGRYLATLESRDQLTFVRVYLNWWCPEAAAQPMRARVPGLTPSLQVIASLGSLVFSTAKRAHRITPYRDLHPNPSTY